MDVPPYWHTCGRCGDSRRRKLRTYNDDAQALFLVDLLVYFGAVDTFNLYRSQLVETFELLGSLDATIAIACFMQRVPDHCHPRVVADGLIDIQAGHHPLIANPTKNSVRLDGTSALVTGTNMAGKTTFIKMVGTNIGLGRTLGVCLASSATLPGSSVMACIHGEHSIASGKSHYFAAIETISRSCGLPSVANAGYS